MQRHHRALAVALVAIAMVLTTAACGSSDSPTTTAKTGAAGQKASSGDRPTTTARLEIVDPAPNAQTQANVTLKMNLIGATVAPPETVTGPLRPDQGHIHVSVDGQLVSMNYGLEAPLTNLSPGPHSVQAEFVAIDHAPFKNRVVAAVLFQVVQS